MRTERGIAAWRWRSSDTTGGLAGQPGGEEVLDVGYPGVQQIEALEEHPQAVAELVVGLRVDDRRLTGLDAVVFEERTWTEVANSKAAERPSWHGFWWSKRGASRHDPVQRARDVLFAGRHVDEIGLARKRGPGPRSPRDSDRSSW